MPPVDTDSVAGGGQGDQPGSDDSLTAELLHFQQAPDQTAVKTDRLARDCEEGEEGEKEECEEEEVMRLT